MQKKTFFLGNFYFFTKKNFFFCDFSTFYGQRSVTTAWATRSPWNILFLFSLVLTHFRETPEAENLFPPIFWHNQKVNAIFFLVILIFLEEKNLFSGVFSSFYGQRSVTAAWATCSPWSI